MKDQIAERYSPDWKKVHATQVLNKSKKLAKDLGLGH